MPELVVTASPQYRRFAGDSLPSHRVRAIKTNERNSLFGPVLKSSDSRKRNPAFYVIKRSLRAGGEAVIFSN